MNPRGARRRACAQAAPSVLPKRDFPSALLAENKQPIRRILDAAIVLHALFHALGIGLTILSAAFSASLAALKMQAFRVSSSSANAIVVTPTRIALTMAKSPIAFSFPASRTPQA